LDYDKIYIAAAMAQAKKSYKEGGIPIGAALVIDQTIVALGHNRRVQQNDSVLHAEIDCLRNAGRLTPDEYRRSTIYTTLSPCSMCSGAIVLFGIPRVVIGENSNFFGAELWLQDNDVRLKHMANCEIEDMLREFIDHHPDLWLEDIGTLNDDPD
jgi:cytosine deaminase